VLDVKSDSEPNLTREAYLRFDLGSLSSASNARFRVYAWLSDTDSVSATLYSVTAGWSAATLTWNTRPGYVSTSPLGVLTAASTTGAWKEIDVTNHVKNQLAAGVRLVSFALHASADSVEKLSLGSSEAAANRPELVVVP
jgi:hypothetical protein